jgi:hypothetical protein
MIIKDAEMIGTVEYITHVISSCLVVGAIVLVVVVGSCVGNATGVFVVGVTGDVLGMNVGDCVGSGVGDILGDTLGMGVGDDVGSGVGDILGDTLGADVGDFEGDLLGIEVGSGGSMLNCIVSPKSKSLPATCSSISLVKLSKD